MQLCQCKESAKLIRTDPQSKNSGGQVQFSGGKKNPRQVNKL